MHSEIPHEFDCTPEPKSSEVIGSENASFNSQNSVELIENKATVSKLSQETDIRKDPTNHENQLTENPNGFNSSIESAKRDYDTHSCSFKNTDEIDEYKYCEDVIEIILDPYKRLSQDDSVKSTFDSYKDFFQPDPCCRVYSNEDEENSRDLLINKDSCSPDTIDVPSGHDNGKHFKPDINITIPSFLGKPSYLEQYCKKHGISDLTGSFLRLDKSPFLKDIPEKPSQEDTREYYLVHKCPNSTEISSNFYDEDSSNNNVSDTEKISHESEEPDTKNLNTEDIINLSLLANTHVILGTNEEDFQTNKNSKSYSVIPTVYCLQNQWININKCNKDCSQPNSNTFEIQNLDNEEVNIFRNGKSFQVEPIACTKNKTKVPINWSCDCHSCTQKEPEENNKKSDRIKGDNDKYPICILLDEVIKGKSNCNPSSPKISPIKRKYHDIHGELIDGESDRNDSVKKKSEKKAKTEKHCQEEDDEDDYVLTCTVNHPGNTDYDNNTPVSLKNKDLEYELVNRVSVSVPVEIKSTACKSKCKKDTSLEDNLNKESTENFTVTCNLQLKEPKCKKKRNSCKCSKNIDKNHKLSKNNRKTSVDPIEVLQLSNPACEDEIEPLVETKNKSTDKTTISPTRNAPKNKTVISTENNDPGDISEQDKDLGPGTSNDSNVIDLSDDKEDVDKPSIQPPKSAIKGFCTRDSKESDICLLQLKDSNEKKKNTSLKNNIVVEDGKVNTKVENDSYNERPKIDETKKKLKYCEEKQDTKKEKSRKKESLLKKRLKEREQKRDTAIPVILNTVINAFGLKQKDDCSDFESIKKTCEPLDSAKNFAKSVETIKSVESVTTTDSKVIDKRKPLVESKLNNCAIEDRKNPNETRTECSNFNLQKVNDNNREKEQVIDEKSQETKTRELSRTKIDTFSTNVSKISLKKESSQSIYPIISESFSQPQNKSNSTIRPDLQSNNKSSVISTEHSVISVEPKKKVGSEIQNFYITIFNIGQPFTVNKDKTNTTIVSKNSIEQEKLKKALKEIGIPEEAVKLFDLKPENKLHEANLSRNLTVSDIKCSSFDPTFKQWTYNDQINKDATVKQPSYKNPNLKQQTNKDYKYKSNFESLVNTNSKAPYLRKTDNIYNNKQNYQSSNTKLQKVKLQESRNYTPQNIKIKIPKDNYENYKNSKQNRQVKEQVVRLSSEMPISGCYRKYPPAPCRPTYDEQIPEKDEKPQEPEKCDEEKPKTSNTDKITNFISKVNLLDKFSIFNNDCPEECDDDANSKSKESLLTRSFNALFPCTEPPEGKVIKQAIIVDDREDCKEEPPPKEEKCEEPKDECSDPCESSVTGDSGDVSEVLRISCQTQGSNINLICTKCESSDPGEVVFDCEIEESPPSLPKDAPDNNNILPENCSNEGGSKSWFFPGTSKGDKSGKSKDKPKETPSNDDTPLIEKHGKAVDMIKCIYNDVTDKLTKQTTEYYNNSAAKTVKDSADTVINKGIEIYDETTKHEKFIKAKSDVEDLASCAVENFKSVGYKGKEVLEDFKCKTRKILLNTNEECEVPCRRKKSACGEKDPDKLPPPKKVSNDEEPDIVMPRKRNSTEMIAAFYDDAKILCESKFEEFKCKSMKLLGLTKEQCTRPACRPSNKRRPRNAELSVEKYEDQPSFNLPAVLSGFSLFGFFNKTTEENIRTSEQPPDLMKRVMSGVNSVKSMMSNTLGYTSNILNHFDEKSSSYDIPTPPKDLSLDEEMNHSFYQSIRNRVNKYFSPIPQTEDIMSISGGHLEIPELQNSEESIVLSENESEESMVQRFTD